MSKAKSQLNYDIANLTVDIIKQNPKNKKVLIDGNAIKNHVFMKSIMDNLGVGIDNMFDNYTSFERLTRYPKTQLRLWYIDTKKEDILDPKKKLGIFPVYGKNSALNSISKMLE